MKKFLGIIVGAVMLMGVAMQAQAALLTEWSYTLVNVELKESANGIATAGENGSFSWEGGKYASSVTAKAPANTPVDFTYNGGAYSPQMDSVANQSTELGTDNPSFGTQDLFTLSFSYSVQSSTESNVRMNVTYNIPLQLHYDAATGTEYVFYNANDVSAQGATAITYDGYHYGLTGVGLFIDGVATLTTVIDGVTYHGWAINEDSRTNLYDKDGKFLGTKDNIGDFNIEAYFSFASTNLNPGGDPTPTPEPATMILTGLGLAGLGVIRRRKANKA